MEKAKAEKRPTTTGIIPNPKIKLLDQVREMIRLKHYSIRTEQAYLQWIKRFIFFHQKRHRREVPGLQDLPRIPLTLDPERTTL